MKSEFGPLAQDYLSPLGQVTIRAMFGGEGLYLDGFIIGLIGDTIYFKVDAITKPIWVQAGLTPFMYDGKKGAPVAMSYYCIPDSAYDDADEMRQWAQLALAAAKRAKRSKPG
jgi:DNA transformation protein and related proteins